MSLTSKWYQMLNLLQTRQYLTVNDMTKVMEATVQTIKRNVLLLNEQLADIAEIQYEKGKYRLIILDVKQFQEVMNGRLKKETDFNSPGRRIAYLLKRFITQRDFVVIDDLADELAVSRGTIIKDLKQVKNSIKKYTVRLTAVPNKGIKIEGDEFHLRLLILNEVYDYYSDHYTISDQTQQKVNGLAKTFKLNHTMINLLTKVTAISIKRILSQQNLTHPIPYYNNFEKDSAALENFIYHLEKEYNFTLGSYDQDFISFPINTRVTTTVIDSRMEKYEDTIQTLFNQMVQAIKTNFVTDFDENQLFHDMKYHLMFMLNRVIFHLDGFDLFTNEIQAKYPFSYELARVAVNVIENNLNIAIKSPEISYLAIYFELALHKTKEEKKRKVAVVCSTGRGTAAMILRQVKEVLGPKIDISQYSETDYQELDLKNYVAIFSTIPLETDNTIPVIHVTNLFDKHLIRDAWNKVNDESFLEHKNLDFSFQIFTGKRSYKETVEEMITELIRQKKLGRDFLSLWKEREKKHPTIFDSGIGFPHTINKGFSKIVFSIAVLKGSLLAQEVQLIFLVGIPEMMSEDTEKTLMKIYDLIFAIAQDQTHRKQAAQLLNKSEFIAFIKKEVLI